MNNNTIIKYGLLVVLAFFLHVSLFAQNTEVIPSYKDQLIKRALSLQLHEKRYWRILLHYLDEPMDKDSQVDDPKFFCSAEGKTNPQAELIATLESFFTQPVKNTKHPTLRFIARYQWLKTELNFDSTKLPYDPLPEFEKIFQDIDPSSLYMIFPAGYIESPASMFGHTLLLIERNNRPWLKSMSVNYAAITQETSGPIFAAKGLMGIYKGYYSYLPYYKKILEYNAVENRDLWEYKFNFSVAEIRKLIMHMVELEKIFSYYYFLDENCSYNLLFLLEAGRPQLNLVSKFHHASEPIDTLREVIAQHAIQTKKYRPSTFRKILHLADKLSSEQVDYAIELGRGDVFIDKKIDHIAPTLKEKAQILDLSTNYCQYLLAKNDIDIAQYRKIFFSLLKERNKIINTEDHYKDLPAPISPDFSHHPRKIGIGGGIENNAPFAELQFRFTNHHLLDDNSGLNKNAQLIFGNIFLRYYKESNDFFLESFDIIDISAFSLSSKFGMKNCLFLKTGLHREIINSKYDDRHLTYYVNFGPGLAYDLTLFVFYISPQVYASASPLYENYSNLEFGGRTCLVSEYGIWKSYISGQYRIAPFYNEHHVYIGNVAERFALNVNNYLVVEANYTNSFKKEIWEYIFKYQHCF